ncbi:MAG: secretin N-terminal domain-containing protein [Thiolinea sp.]
MIKPAAANKTEVILDFNSPVTIPKGFVLQNPPRIVFDFPKVEVLPQARSQDAGQGAVRSISSANNKGQARVVVALKQFVNYSIEARGDDLVLVFENGGAAAQPVQQTVAVGKTPVVPPVKASQQSLTPTETYDWYRAPGGAIPNTPTVTTQPAPKVARPAAQPAPRMAPAMVDVPPPVTVTQPAPRIAPQLPPARPVPVARTAPQRPAPAQQAAVNALRSVDFRRNAEGGGRVIIILPTANVKVSDDKRANTLNLTLHDVDVPKNWQKRLDVLDFATPVGNIAINQRGGNGQVTINGVQNFNYRTEMDRNIYTVHIDKIQVADNKKQLKPGEKEKKTFKGEKLSLNFQDIEVRAVLQLLADFTNKNIVVSDSVDGSITVRLKDVPWDQALDIVLESKNLGMRENGNVIWVAPNAELEAKEAKELELAKRKIELEPLVTEYIPINFAKASELVLLIQKRSTNTEEGSHSLLSERGSVSYDERTNTLLVKDTASQVAQIRDLIKVLDVPVQQVLIESRIVIANDEFGKELGAKFGAAPRWINNDSIGLGAGSLTVRRTAITPQLLIPTAVVATAPSSCRVSMIA